jgi:hypothetical protein
MSPWGSSRQPRQGLEGVCAHVCVRACVCCVRVCVCVCVCEPYFLRVTFVCCKVQMRLRYWSFHKSYEIKLWYFQTPNCRLDSLYLWQQGVRVGNQITAALHICSFKKSCYYTTWAMLKCARTYTYIQWADTHTHTCKDTNTHANTQTRARTHTHMLDNVHHRYALCKTVSLAHKAHTCAFAGNLPTKSTWTAISCQRGLL